MFCRLGIMLACSKDSLYYLVVFFCYQVYSWLFSKKPYTKYERVCNIDKMNTVNNIFLFFISMNVGPTYMHLD